MDKRHIVLIGMPASGKSTAGVIAAKILGYDFVDTDLLIQRRTGKLLSEIIEERGVDGFLEVENEAGRDVNPELRSVIATGGSMVYNEEAMKHLSDIGTVIYLETSYDELTRRLSDIRQRGVVVKEGQTFGELFRERTVLYEKYADHTVNEDGKDTEGVVKEIVDILSE